MRYLRHGEGLPLWPTFVEQLESSAAVRRSTADAIAGAHTAFEWFSADAGPSLSPRREPRGEGMELSVSVGNKYGHKEMVALLLAHGADMNARNSQG